MDQRHERDREANRLRACSRTAPRGIHHGDVRGGNIGRREISSTKTGSKRKRAENQVTESGVVIFDFSHAQVFEECDVEQCWDIRFARERLFGGGPE